MNGHCDKGYFCELCLGFGVCMEMEEEEYYCGEEEDYCNACKKDKCNGCMEEDSDG